MQLEYSHLKVLRVHNQKLGDSRPGVNHAFLLKVVLFGGRRENLNHQVRSAFGAMLGEHALAVFMRAPSLADLILRANPCTNASSDSGSSFLQAKI